jgi:hypothetical protein
MEREIERERERERGEREREQRESPNLRRKNNEFWKERRRVFRYLP